MCDQSGVSSLRLREGVGGRGGQLKALMSQAKWGRWELALLGPPVVTRGAVHLQFWQLQQHLSQGHRDERHVCFELTEGVQCFIFHV